MKSILDQPGGYCFYMLFLRGVRTYYWGVAMIDRFRLGMAKQKKNETDEKVKQIFSDNLFNFLEK
jgi:hypothetical protein